MPEHAPEIERLLDEQAIRRLLARYCRGIDRLDRDLVLSCFHPDGHADHGYFRGSPEDFWKVVQPALTNLFSATMHTLGQSHIEVSGAVAHAETHCLATHRIETEGVRTVHTFAGRYVDRLENIASSCTSGARITRRATS